MQVFQIDTLSFLIALTKKPESIGLVIVTEVLNLINTIAHKKTLATYGYKVTSVSALQEKKPITNGGQLLVFLVFCKRKDIFRPNLIT